MAILPNAVQASQTDCPHLKRLKHDRHISPLPKHVVMEYLGVFQIMKFCNLLFQITLL